MIYEILRLAFYCFGFVPDLGRPNFVPSGLGGFPVFRVLKNGELMTILSFLLLVCLVKACRFKVTAEVTSSVSKSRG
jgi:hypothetical protein